MKTHNTADHLIMRFPLYVYRKGEESKAASLAEIYLKVVIHWIFRICICIFSTYLYFVISSLHITHQCYWQATPFLLKVICIWNNWFTENDACTYWMWCKRRNFAFQFFGVCCYQIQHIATHLYVPPITTGVDKSTRTEILKVWTSKQI